MPVSDPIVCGRPGTRNHLSVSAVRVLPEVGEALAGRHPVVALESAIFSRLGLPPPAGAEALARCLEAIREAGAVPALTAVLDGVARVGLEEAEQSRLLDATAKVAARDLPVAVARAWPVGATTVSASLALAGGAGVAVLATGGIGGVHRGVEATGDVSADLDAIAGHPVVTVSAGAKAILDLGRTLERLESLGVPVLGFGCDEFPAFWARSSGLPVPHRVDSPAEVAAVVRAARDLGYGGGVLVAVPVPAAHEVPLEVVEAAVEAAVAEVAGRSGPWVTPLVLERVTAATGGRTTAANVALAERNAGVAAAVAAALVV